MLLNIISSVSFYLFLKNVATGKLEMADGACIRTFEGGRQSRLERRSAGKAGSGSNKDEEWRIQAAAG